MTITKVKYPIWYDMAFFIPVGEYKILYGGTFIYSGYATSPDETATGVNIYVKSILMNYLKPDMEVGENGDFAHNTTQTRVFQLWMGTESGPRYEMTVWWDWSYSQDWFNHLNTSGDLLSRPISTHWNRMQVIPMTIWDTGEKQNKWMFSYRTSTGGEGIKIDTLVPSNLFITVTALPSTVKGMTDFDLSKNNIPLLSWKAEDEKCGYGSLYYINQFGGWDSYLLENNIVRKQDIDRQEWNTGSNWSSTEFDYQYITKSIRETISTNTGWLSDNQSANMYNNLFTSPMIYFQDFSAEEPGHLYPVNLTKTSWNKKEFKNGRHLISYNLEFKFSHIKQRQ